MRTIGMPVHALNLNEFEFVIVARFKIVRFSKISN